MFEKHKNDGVFLGGRDFLAEEGKIEHEVEVEDDKTEFIVQLGGNGNQIVHNAITLHECVFQFSNDEE